MFDPASVTDLFWVMVLERCSAKDLPNIMATSKRVFVLKAKYGPIVRQHKPNLTLETILLSCRLHCSTQKPLLRDTHVPHVAHAEGFES